MSLSSWFNNYVFKQTSFKHRKWGVYASAYAVFLTFVLFGIWHGAGLNFMIIGFLQALAINYEFFTKKWRFNFFAMMPNFLRIWVGRILTYLFFGISLVFFFSPDINSTFIYFSELFEINGSILVTAYREIPLSAIFFLSVYFFFELLNNDYMDTFNKLKNLWLGNSVKNKLFRWALYSSILAILFVLGNKVQQFIYAQF